MIQSYHTYAQSQIHNYTKSAVPTPLSSIDGLYLPIGYIHSLTKAERRIFLYLHAHYKRVSFRCSMAEIALMANCSRNTAKRATNKFHNDGVITKYQPKDCFDINLFAIETNSLKNQDKKILQKMSHININNIYIYTDTDSDADINIPREQRARVVTATALLKKGGSGMITEKLQLLQKVGLELTAQGQIYFDLFPVIAVKHAVAEYSKAKGVRSASAFISQVINKWCTKNHHPIDWRSMYNKLEELGLEKRADYVIHSRIPISATASAPKITENICKTSSIDLYKPLRDKIQWHTDLRRDKLRSLEELPNSPNRQQWLDKVEFHTKAIEELGEKLNQDQIQGNNTMSGDMTQAEMQYHSLMAKIKRDSAELMQWKKIAKLEDSVSSMLVEETKRISTVVIKKLTETITRDLEKVSELEELLKKMVWPPVGPVSDNFHDEIDLEQGQIH